MIDLSAHNNRPKKNARARFCGKAAGGPSLVVSASASTIELGQSVTISGEMSNANQITYSVNGSQIGTGSKVTFTPKEAGEFKVEVSATSSKGTAKNSVTIKVIEVGPYGGTAALVPGKIQAENYDILINGKVQSFEKTESDL